MTQTLLPIWVLPEDVEFTTLADMRADEYEEKGPGLVREVMSVLDSYQNNHAGLDTYIPQLNQLSMELCVISPIWFDFSCACFELFLDPPKYNHETKIRMLRNLISAIGGKGDARYI